MRPVLPDIVPAGVAPTIDHAPALAIDALPAFTDAVLAALFADYARVTIEGELAGGFSGTCVLTVTPPTATPTRPNCPPS